MKNQQIHRTDSPRMGTAKLATLMMVAMFFSVAPLLAQAAANANSSDSFAVLGGSAVTLTDSNVIGDVGSPTAVTVTTSTVVGTVYPAGDLVASTAYSDFLIQYDAVALEPCLLSLTGDFAGLVLTPGVYCIQGASTTTNGTLTLDAQGDPNAVWTFKVGTAGVGALTGTGLSVVMANGGQPCNVSWWVADAVTMSASSLKGKVLAGAGTTFTGGSLIGQVLAKAGVTMTGTAVYACSNLATPGLPGTPGTPNDEFCKDHEKNKKHCNKGAGNEHEDCDEDKSEHDEDSHSDDKHGDKSGHHSERKGGHDR